MGMFDGLLGGVVGAEMATVVNGLIEKHGGIQGIVAQLEQQGLGGTVRSWVGTGPNQPITADQVHQAFGPEHREATRGQVRHVPRGSIRQAFAGSASGDRQTHARRRGAAKT